MESQLQAIATVISLMNPAMCASIFAKCTQGQSKEEKLGNSFKAVLAIFIILVSAAFFGAKILQVFGISLDAFSTAGGVVLIWMGFSMLKPSKSTSEAGHKSSLTPLILFAASPGTITGVITLSVAQTGKDIPVSALLAVLIASCITFVTILLPQKFMKATKSDSLFKQTLTSFMGLIVLAMGFQFALSGIKSFFS